MEEDKFYPTAGFTYGVCAIVVMSMLLLSVGMAFKNSKVDMDKVSFVIERSLIKHEGFRTKAYKDGDGYAIGYGRSAFKGETVTKQRALASLRDEIHRITNKSKDILDGTFGSHVAYGLMSYQLGKNWRFEHVKSWALLENGDYEKFSKEIENSIWFRQTPERVVEVQRVLFSE